MTMADKLNARRKMQEAAATAVRARALAWRTRSDADIAAAATAEREYLAAAAEWRRAVQS